MNDLNVMVWLLPVLFMIHDFEEIIMAEIWSRRYRREINVRWPNRQPFGLNHIYHYPTAAFSIAVAIEFVLISLISLFSVLLQSYFVWYGVFMGLILHMILVHLPLCVLFKRYVPGVVTSIILLLPGVWILYQAAQILNYGAGNIAIAGVLGIALLMVILPILHKLMGTWSKWMFDYARV